MRHIDAEDVLHEVAFNVFSKIDFETTIENIAAYFYRSVRNKISDIMRKPKKTFSLSSFEKGGINTLLETTQNCDESVEDKLEKTELKEEIHRALQHLSPDYRNILIATEFDMKTLKELSDEWQVPLGTLLSRRHRALAKLQKILENYYVK
jgi:RNA polymerase sigma-70 factor (ECF subfamily)